MCSQIVLSVHAVCPRMATCRRLFCSPRMLRVSRAPVTSVFFVFAPHAGEGTVPKISGPGSEKVEGVSRRAEVPPDEESMLMASFPRLFSVGWTAGVVYFSLVWKVEVPRGQEGLRI